MQLQHLLPHQLQQAIREGWPLLVPAGCIEYHGPHLPLGVDTLIVEELCVRVARRVNAIVAPPFWYGPTGYAVTGPDQGTVDVSTERFGRHAKDVLSAFWDIGFKWIVVCQHHQSADGPEGLALRQAGAEVAFEKTLAERGKGWWGRNPLPINDNVFERIQVWPSVLPPADKVTTGGDHAGFYETALVLGARPDLVEIDRLGMSAPWYTNTSSSTARRATQEAGERIWSAMVDAWVDKLTAMIKPRRPTPQDVTVKGLF